jgi:Cys-tRNA(Pro)/Cys-tRNA(Cys) deacylase
MNDALPARLARFIALHGIDAHVVASGNAAPTAEAAARLLDVPLASIVKTMLLTDGARFVAAILPGNRRLDRSRAAAALGTGALRFASPADVLEQTGFPAGGVAPLGFAHELAVVVDSSLPHGAVDGNVIAGGGREDLLMRVAVADLIRHNDARVASICQDEIDRDRPT